MATIDNLQIEITANADKATKGIERLANALSALKRASNVKGDKLKDTAKGFRSLNNAISEVSLASVKRIERLADALQKLNQVKIGKSVARALSSSQEEIAIPKTSGTTMTESETKDVETTSSGMEKLSTSTKDAASRVAEFRKQWAFWSTAAKYTNSFFRSVLPDFSKFGNLLRRLVSPLKSFISSIGRIALYRGIRSLIKSIAAGIKEGVQNLAMFSKLMNELDTHSANKVMSLYTSNFLYLKNALATAVIPILKTLEPIVDRLINKFIDFINVIAQLMSVLSGATTYTKAKYYYKDYADEMDKASGSASKLNKQLAKFDELNNLTTSGGGGSGSNVPDYSKMFEDPVPIEKWIKDLKNKNWFEIGRTISDKIASALENIDWENIKNKAGLLGTKLASLLNGFFTPRLFGDIGKTIAEGLNTALRFLYNFGVEFDAHEFMYSIVTGITKFFETFDFALLAETLNVWVDNLKDAIKGAIDGISDADWKKIGRNIFSFFSHLELDTVALAIGAITVLTVGKIIKWVFTSGILSFLGQALGLYIAKNGLTVTLSEIGVTLKGAVTGAAAIGEFIAGAIVAAIGGYFIGNGLGQIWAAITGNSDMLSEYQSANPFTNDSWLSDFAYEWFKGWAHVEEAEKAGTATAEKLKEVMDDIKSKASETGESIGIALSGIDAALDSIGFEDWWNNDVAPYFNLPKWTGLVSTIKESISQVWTDTVDYWTEEVPKWWDDNVAPWFTFDKWLGIYTNIKDALEQIWTDTVDYWTTDTNKFFEENVKPFFSLDNWLTIFGGIKDALSNVLGGAKGFATSFINTLADMFEGFVNGTIDGLTALANLKDKMSGGSGGLTPTHITIPRFASGGYPIQGSMFIAGERGAELVGNINGKTGVANTDNITEAMYAATYDAMTRALSEGGMNVTLEGDANKIFRVVRDEAIDFMNRTQSAPFPI